MKFKSTISKEEINELPLDQYEGKIHLITQENGLNELFDEINACEYVGFDTETKPVFVKGKYNHVALVQIAIPGSVFLIRTNLVGVPDQLRDLFENEGIKKIGVALADDIKDLRKLREFNPGGFVEFSELVNKIGIESNGLRSLAAIILGFRISKNAQVSNWEAPKLEARQKRYAATDAWVGLKMYGKLLSHGLI